MCIQDYKIGQRIYPIVREEVADGSGFFTLAPDANRVGIIFGAGSAAATWTIRTVGNTFMPLLLAPVTGPTTQPFVLLMQWHGNITTGEFRVTTTAAATVRFVELMAEPELMDEIRGRL